MLSTANQRLQQDRPISNLIAQGRHDGAAAKPVSQLDGAVGAITSEIAQLEVNMANLLRRLNPILAEEKPSAEGCANTGIEAAAHSPLLDELAMHANRLRSLNELMLCIQRRLVV